MGELRERFPLFPLGLVLLPTELVPLHIFEDRYRLMIGECLDTGNEFGIVWLSDSGLKEIGCSARVTRLLKKMDDGRMDVLVEGVAPFRLLRRIEDLPYPAGDVELLEDAGAQADPTTATDARDLYADLVERVTDERPDEADLGDMAAYDMAATVEFALDAKQVLLELRSEADRMTAVAELFGKTMQRLEFAEQAGEVARSNGKIHLGGGGGGAAG
jgi:Lon protease-like protein